MHFEELIPSIFQQPNNCLYFFSWVWYIVVSRYSLFKQDMSYNFSGSAPYFPINWLFIFFSFLLVGVSETVVLNMSTLVWSVVTTVQGRVPVASEVFFLARIFSSSFNFNVVDQKTWRIFVKNDCWFDAKSSQQPLLDPAIVFSEVMGNYLIFFYSGLGFGCKLLQWWRHTCIFWRI